MPEQRNEDSPLLELTNRLTAWSPGDRVVGEGRTSTTRSATFNQDDPSSLENYHIPAEAPPPYTPDAPAGSKPEDVSSPAYAPAAYSAPQTQAPAVQTEQQQSSFVLHSAQPQPAEPEPEWQVQPNRRRWTRRRIYCCAITLVVVIAVILGIVLKVVLPHDSSDSSSSSGSGSSSNSYNYKIVPQTAMTYVGDDDDSQPGLLFFTSTTSDYVNATSSITQYFTDAAFYVIGGNAATYRNSWPLYKSGMGWAVGAAAVLEGGKWTYYAASTDYDGVLQVLSGTPSTSGFFNDETLSTKPLLTEWRNNVTVAGMAMASGTTYNNSTQQWDNGFSLVACASDNIVHEYTWAMNTSKLSDRFTWPISVKCNLPTMIRHGSASFMMQRPDNTSDTIATWRRNDTGWTMGDKNFTVPQNNRYAACGEIFAFQDATGALKVASMTYPDSGAASFGAVTTVVASGAPNGTSIACKWKSADEMRVYYQDDAGFHYFDKKPGSSDWTKGSLTMDWDIAG